MPFESNQGSFAAAGCLRLSNGYDSGRVTVYAKFEHVAPVTIIIEIEIMYEICRGRAFVGGIAGEATDSTPDIFGSMEHAIYSGGENRRRPRRRTGLGFGW